MYTCACTIIVRAIDISNVRAGIEIMRGGDLGGGEWRDRGLLTRTRDMNLQLRMKHKTLDVILMLVRIPA